MSVAYKFNKRRTAPDMKSCVVTRMCRRNPIGCVCCLLSLTCFCLMNMFALRYISRYDGHNPQHILETESSTNPPRFDPEKPSLVLILSCQRCGSSFFGRIFDNIPGGMYVFEPLDALYTAMYGTEEGWNVPADIFSWKFGMERRIPFSEFEEVTSYLRNIFSCAFDELPTEFIIHKFWDQFRREQTSATHYVKCLDLFRLTIERGRCYGHIKGVCPNRFGADVQSAVNCKQRLWNESSAPSSESGRTRDLQFDSYARCMKLQRTRARGCEAGLSDLCQRARLRTMKTIRLSMESVEKLIESTPNLKVIHFIRDPRAVLSSMKHFVTGHSLYAGNETMKEARLHCRRMVKDISLRQELERKYPGTFVQVIFDDFIRNITTNTMKVFKFANISVPPNYTVSEAIVSKISSSEKWRTRLKDEEYDSLTNSCKNVLRLIGRD